MKNWLKEEYKGILCWGNEWAEVVEFKELLDVADEWCHWDEERQRSVVEEWAKAEDRLRRAIEKRVDVEDHWKIVEDKMQEAMEQVLTIQQQRQESKAIWEEEIGRLVYD